MRLFSYIAHDSSERHVRMGCAKAANAPMLEPEHGWPICQDCLAEVVRQVRQETEVKGQPLTRCDSCGAWVFAGKPCGTCSAVTLPAI
jgi:hypothetical protein